MCTSTPRTIEDRGLVASDHPWSHTTQRVEHDPAQSRICVQTPLSELGLVKGMMMANICAEKRLDVSVAQARDWFLGLEDHPEWYRFETHGGFVFVSGSFAEPGALFQTQERFFGVTLTLAFELTSVERSSFGFRLIRPRLPVGGSFIIEPQTDGKSMLTLAIEGSTRVGSLVLHCPIVRQAVRQQIKREVDHIAQGMQLRSL